MVKHERETGAMDYVNILDSHVNQFICVGVQKWGARHFYEPLVPGYLLRRETKNTIFRNLDRSAKARREPQARAGLGLETSKTWVVFVIQSEIRWSNPSPPKHISYETLVYCLHFEPRYTYPILGIKNFQIFRKLGHPLNLIKRQLMKRKVISRLFALGIFYAHAIDSKIRAQLQLQGCVSNSRKAVHYFKDKKYIEEIPHRFNSGTNDAWVEEKRKLRKEYVRMVLALYNEADEIVTKLEATTAKARVPTEVEWKLHRLFYNYCKLYHLAYYTMRDAPPGLSIILIDGKRVFVTDTRANFWVQSTGTVTKEVKVEGGYTASVQKGCSRIDSALTIWPWIIYIQKGAKEMVYTWRNGTFEDTNMENELEKPHLLLSNMHNPLFVNCQD
ncbi:hypothetical protein F5880DRAFT_1504234 [Lentinula raphanica]|nr:hypothetical protein F5880DRAFT_1504234 [Lentinula raphanica]